MSGAPLLVINAGSSSARLALFAEAGGRQPLRDRHLDAPPSHLAHLLHELLADAKSTPSDVIHRIVRGGSRRASHARLDDAVTAEIAAAAPLAPLHNPAALALIEASRQVLPGARQWAAFDSVYFAGLPEVARGYALPAPLVEERGLFRLGFHGLAHQSMVEGWQRRSRRKGRVISFQLGSGASVAASREGQAVDTSMGFSPAEGLVMATRAGDVDPGLLLHLLDAGLAPAALRTLLAEKSGLLGVSQLSGDMRLLLASERPEAGRAVALYGYRARKYLGAYLAVLGGADAIVFGGGVGEHAPTVRAAIVGGLEWCGVVVDEGKNRALLGEPGAFHAAASAVELWVLPPDEAALLSQIAAGLIGGA